MAAKKAAVKRRSRSRSPALARGVSGITDAGSKAGDDEGAGAAVAVAPPPKRRARKPKASVAEGGKVPLVHRRIAHQGEDDRQVLGLGLHGQGDRGAPARSAPAQAGRDVEHGFTPST